MSDRQPQIPPDMPLSVTLPAQQWLLVQQVLGEGPYRMVAPLIGEIQRQCLAHAERQPPMDEPEIIRRRANGGVAEASHA